jgi:UDP-2-acetamido-3-amino-2,3-dideoxy-glucuronate N-acetyltransferase
MKPKIHESSFIDQNVRIGDYTKVWHFCHISKNAIIGEHCSLGQNVFIGENVQIGNNVRIQNNVSIYQGVELEDFVFCGPSCVFTNDMTPRAKFPKNKEYLNTLVRYGASIGANATILCGIEIGRHAIVGAGAVVTRSVLNHSIVIGNPAKHHGWACECGIKLDQTLECLRCKRSYKLDEGRLYLQSSDSRHD